VPSTAQRARRLFEAPSALGWWAAAAVVSLALAAWVGLERDRLVDLGQVRGWLDFWRTTGLSVYPFASLDVDYPPHALVLLMPLDAIPASALIPLYLVINAALNIAMAWRLVTWLSEETGVDTSSRVRLTLMCVVLSWGAVRVGLWNGQTVALAILAGIRAVRALPLSPWLSGAALMIAATKPTLGIGFGLILLCRGGIRAVAIGLGLTLALTAVFDVTVGQWPLVSLVQYADSLERMYAGDSYVRGFTTTRSIFVDLSGGGAWAHLAFLIQSLLALVALGAVAWKVRGVENRRGLLATACLFWMLLAMPHQRYYLVLLAPIIWLLIFAPDTVARPGARWPAIWGVLLVGFNVIDGPLAIRMLAERLYLYTPYNWYWLWWISYAIVAPVIVALFVVLLRALWRMADQRTSNRSSRVAV
jgi:hypothetical protein